MPSLPLHDALQLAVNHHKSGELDQAETLYRVILSHHPNNSDALHLLGLLEHRTGRVASAINFISQAIAIAPDIADYHNNLGNALRDAGRSADAAVCYQNAISLKPDFAAAWNNLGTALQDQNLFSDSIQAYQRALSLDDDLVDAHSNLGNALRSVGRLKDAIAEYHRAIQINPNFAPAFNNLGYALSDQGQLVEAIDAYRTTIKLDPDSQTAQSNLLYMLQFLPDISPAEILAEHKSWAARHADPHSRAVAPHSNDRSPDRPLRIGYVSPDFREHAVGRFLLPIFANHDPAQFRIIAFSDVLNVDPLTATLQSRAQAWHSTLGLSDVEVAQLIRDEKIDILIDLSVHSGRNRLMAFARKPAPIQITYLGYPGTTGMLAMDYRITDVHLDPPGANDCFYSEKSLRLPNYWCYQPYPLEPQTAPVAAVSNDYITFGSLNNLTKISPATINAWSKLLNIVPDSHLLLFAYAGAHRDTIYSWFAAQGISAGRIEFIGWQPFDQYLATYHRIDIALDSFPYTGGTTTCDALWMGVPVVTLAGDIATRRAGVSILSSAGLAEFIARSQDDYIRIASALAGDFSRIIELRSTLRQRILESPLCDGPAFTRNLESAYRQVWKEWCGAQP